MVVHRCNAPLCCCSPAPPLRLSPVTKASAARAREREKERDDENWFPRRSVRLQFTLVFSSIVDARFITGN
jgi:hypothetical protein